MIRFNNDYNHGAHPKILEALQRYNDQSFPGYGVDDLCKKAEKKILQLAECPNGAVHFLLGGTGVNYIFLASALRPFQSVISAQSGHIEVHETAAVENSGHKIHTVKAENGKISLSGIKAVAGEYAKSDLKEHIPQPKVVYISHPTELGTLYSLEELTAIRELCDRYGLYLYIDGARMAYALGAESDVTLPDIARLADAFYCGGTKCGALFGEALVISNPALQPHFRSYMKQNGSLLAKGWLLGLQFDTLFTDGLYTHIGKKAVALSQNIKDAFVKKGIPLLLDSPTNQQFVILARSEAEKLGQKYVFEPWGDIDDTHVCVRFCTGFNTTENEVNALVADITAL